MYTIHNNFRIFTKKKQTAMLSQQRILRISFYYFLMCLLPTVETIWKDLSEMTHQDRYTEALVLVVITTYVYCVVKVLLYFFIFAELAHAFRNHVLRPGWEFFMDKIPEVKREIMGF